MLYTPTDVCVCVCVCAEYLETSRFVEEVFVSSMVSANRGTDCLSVLNKPSTQSLYTDLVRARQQADNAAPGNSVHLLMCS